MPHISQKASIQKKIEAKIDILMTAMEYDLDSEFDLEYSSEEEEEDLEELQELIAYIVLHNLLASMKDDEFWLEDEISRAERRERSGMSIREGGVMERVEVIEQAGGVIEKGIVQTEWQRGGAGVAAVAGVVEVTERWWGVAEVARVVEVVVVAELGVVEVTAEND
ncbi:hypothetical protein BDZ91DRAFT_796454 [Kalaharituber pfeilii]|nr:hypothetical protein BDZ91DRAFT_796454 [Kalaharituber pfeilii]